MTAAPHAEATAPRFACPLAAAGAPERFGAKAATLARLRARGLPVPDGFVVTREALEAFLDAGGLRDAIEAIEAGIRRPAPDPLRTASAEIRALVTGASLPAAVRVALRDHRDSLPGGRELAVRSSAIGEDSARASFAGQLDSILRVTTALELEQALLACWASYWSDRALAYRLAGRGRLDGMAVLVQTLVRSRVSGVLFTAPPVPGLVEHDEFLVEYGAGWGEAVVSGRVNPGRAMLARDGLRWRLLARPEDWAPELEGVFPTGPQMAELARAAGAIEAALGEGQDVEWTLDDEGRLAILQARPITTMAAAGPAGPVAADAPAPVLWSNANVNENFPEPISPFLYSIAELGYYHYFRNLGRAFGISQGRLRRMEPALRRLIGVHGARMYYNLTHIHAVLRLAPFGDLLAEFFNRFVGADRLAPRASEPDARTGRLGQATEVGVIALKTAGQYLRLGRRVAAFERVVDGFAERTRPARLEGRSLGALVDDLRAFLEIRASWTNAALADAAAMVCYGLLERLLRRAFPAEDQAGLHNTLLKGLPGLVSSEPALRLFELARRVGDDPRLAAVFARGDGAAILAALDADPGFAAFREALATYLDRWGFRCSGELMLTVPSFQERPAALLEILALYVTAGNESPATVLRRQQADREAETARVLAALRRRPLHRRLPLLRQSLVVGLVLRGTQRAVAYRERARLKQALAYSRCRRIALALGDRLVDRGWLEARDDVFFLTWQELTALAGGAAMFPYSVPRLVALRKSEHAALRAMRPPDSFVLPEDAYLPSTDRPRHRAAQPDGQGGELAGVPACGGRVTARAVVLADVAESGRVRAGDVLVTRQTDPGWGPIFPLVGGLVIERGGMLSHGAIIAREFGIPAVVGVPGATRRIPSGAVVDVDGDRGRVRVHA
jgi:pyruvate,water dikinase